MSTSQSIKKILVVEDSAEIADVMREILCDLGYEVAVKSNGVEAMSFVHHFEPDLVISDYRMPRMDGIQLLARLKANDAIRPLVFLATADIGFDPQLAYTIGAEAVLKKPFTAKALAETIARFTVPGEEVWSQAPTEMNIDLSWSAAVDDNLGFFRSLGIGRGGLVTKADFVPKVNERIVFSIDIKRSSIPKLEGSGYVRWVEDENDGYSSLGIEFEYIHGKARQELLRLIMEAKDLQPYIPASHSG